jgi:hypothetical protein
MKMPQGRVGRGHTTIKGAGKARITISLSPDKRGMVSGTNSGEQAAPIAVLERTQCGEKPIAAPAFGFEISAFS